MMLAGTQLAELSKSVLDIQKALVLRGFNPGPLDGKMGPKTLAAIKAFQQTAGLKVDGIVGPITSAALFKSAPTAAALPSGSGLPGVATAVVSAGRTFIDTALSVVRAIAQPEKPLAPEVGSPIARDAYNDTPMSALPAQMPNQATQQIAPMQKPALTSQPWFIPVVAGLGVFALVSMQDGKKGRK